MKRGTTFLIITGGFALAFALAKWTNEKIKTKVRKIKSKKGGKR